MLVNKVTSGFVIQRFDLDSGKCTEQEFIAGEQCDIERLDGVKIEGRDKILLTSTKLYYPYNMVQPGKS